MYDWTEFIAKSSCWMMAVSLLALLAAEGMGDRTPQTHWHPSPIERTIEDNRHVELDAGTARVMIIGGLRRGMRCGQMLLDLLGGE